MSFSIQLSSVKPDIEHVPTTSDRAIRSIGRCTRRSGFANITQRCCRPGATVYSDELRRHKMLAEFRRTDPVRRTAPSEHRPFWALTKHGTGHEVPNEHGRLNDTDSFPAPYQPRLNAPMGNLPEVTMTLEDVANAVFRAATRFGRNSLVPGWHRSVIPAS